MGPTRPDVSRRALVMGAAGSALCAMTACSPRAEARAAPTWSFGFGPTVPSNLEVAVLAGGCFWGVQAVYSHVKGVKESVSGYCGGRVESPTYEQVGTGLTGHAEAVRVAFDPREITYQDILDIFFAVATDPTEVNRQGPDIGPQYRNEIFFTKTAQRDAARTTIQRLDRARVYRRPIATKVTRLDVFYPAEAYHQDYLFENPTQPYIVIHDLPKIEALKQRFPARYAATPIRLVKR